MTLTLRSLLNRTLWFFGMLAVVAFTVLAPSSSLANLISNAGFEDPGFTHSCFGVSCADNFRYLLDSGDTRITGWTVSRQQTVGEQAYWYHVSRYPVFDGEYALSLTDGALAVTNVTVEAGRLYDLRFFSFRDLAPPVSNFAVTVSLGTFQATVLPASATDTGVPVDGNQNWLRYDIFYTPSVGGLLPLSFLNIPDGIATFDGGVTLDAVSLDLAATVPTPAGILLMVAGAFLLLARRRTSRA